eukprot:s2918_g2.t1
MQVLVWKTSIALLLQRAPSISSRWWAGCANSEYGSDFHIALAEAAAITTDEARPCTTPRQGPPAQRLENDFCTWLPRLPKPGRSTLPVLRPSQLPSSGLFCWCRRCFSSTLVPSLVRLAELTGCPSLALRCVPAPELSRGGAQLYVRLKDLSLELLEASAEGASEGNQ